MKLKYLPCFKQAHSPTEFLRGNSPLRYFSARVSRRVCICCYAVLLAFYRDHERKINADDVSEVEGHGGECQSALRK